jgi:YHS domain-containing protein
MKTPVCPSCGCSLVRLGINLATAKRYEHAGTFYSFCCQGCLDIFMKEPEKYLQEISDVVVCPACLAEKHIDHTVALEHEGETVHFCRCPGCLAAFQRDPRRLLSRLTGTV